MTAPHRGALAQRWKAGQSQQGGASGGILVRHLRALLSARHNGDGSGHLPGNGDGSVLAAAPVGRDSTWRNGQGRTEPGQDGGRGSCLQVACVMVKSSGPHVRGTWFTASTGTFWGDGLGLTGLGFPVCKMEVVLRRMGKYGA